MKSRAFPTLCSALAAGALLSGCACIRHVPPGQSLSTALARKPELVALPAPPPPAPAVVLSGGAEPPLPQVQTEKVADAFTLGNLCLQQGRYQEAINAYEAALKDDPSFGEAWNNLAVAYQNLGEEDKAMAAFRKYKMVAAH